MIIELTLRSHHDPTPIQTVQINLPVPHAHDLINHLQDQITGALHRYLAAVIEDQERED